MQQNKSYKEDIIMSPTISVILAEEEKVIIYMENIFMSPIDRS